jgi:hypothetical protein
MLWACAVSICSICRRERGGIVLLGSEKVCTQGICKLEIGPVSAWLSDYRGTGSHNIAGIKDIVSKKGALEGGGESDVLTKSRVLIAPCLRLRYRKFCTPRREEAALLKTARRGREGRREGAKGV